jgi:hypothetical protein
VASQDKNFSALAASQPWDMDGYCPECGRPWRDRSPERPYPAAPFPWRAVLLGVVGLALAITFGLRTWRADRPAPRDCAALPDTAWQVVTTRGRTSCATASNDLYCWTAFGVMPGQSGAAGRPVQRDLLPTAGGVAMLLVGVGGLLRPHLRARVCGRAVMDVVALWAAGEALLALVYLQILVWCVLLVAVRISLGQPLTWEAPDWAADEMLAIFSVLTGR